MHVRKFQVKYCDADFKDELKVSSALGYFEEAACSSADELGFGYAYLKPKNYAFMVSSICVEFKKPIYLSQEMCLRTWPLKPSYVVFGREYQICDENGGVFANASSRWCLVDMQTGKLLQSKVIDNQDYSTYNTDKALENVQWKIPSFSLEDGELRFSLTIANSEYDHNMHVNNTRYADYCLNCFSIAELSRCQIKKFQISYVKQCKEGETLRFYRKKTDDENESYLVQGINGNGETVVQSLIVFEV